MQTLVALGVSSLVLFAGAGASAQEAPPPPDQAVPQEVPPTPPPDGAAQAPAAPTPTPVTPQAGEWAYTDAYGWVWVPASTMTETIDSQPYAYLYTPTYGWTWYASPWGLGAPTYRGRVYGHPYYARSTRFEPRVIVRAGRVGETHVIVPRVPPRARGVYDEGHHR